MSAMGGGRRHGTDAGALVEHRNQAPLSHAVATEPSAYLAFFFFSCLAAFFSFMVLAGFFLSLFFESRLLLISLSPSRLWPPSQHLRCLIRELFEQDYAYPQPCSINRKKPSRLAT